MISLCLCLCLCLSLSVSLCLSLSLSLPPSLPLQSDLPYDTDAHNVRLQDVLNAYVEVETGIEVSKH